MEGTGETITQEIPVAMLNAIEVEGSMDVTVLRGDTQKVEVTAQPELIDLIRTKVDNGVWKIGTMKGYSSDREFTVRITVPALNTVILEGSGDVTTEGVYNTGKTHLANRGSGQIRIDTLRESLLEVLSEGSGDIVIGSGECREMNVRLTGSGGLRAGDLCATHAKAELSGSGTMVIDVLDTLTANLTGSGDLRYRGAPVVISNAVGSGSLIAMP